MPDAGAAAHWRRRLLVQGLAILLVVVAVGRIAATYRVFNQTFDEPAHVATGMEWLDRGTYQYETRHPPLGRVAVAIGPYLSGLRSHGLPFMWDEGNAILQDRGTYLRNLALARAGVLPFVALAAYLVWSWTRRLAGDGAALAGVASLTLLPPVLAHGGVATTDMPVAALLTAALYAFARWLEAPSTARSVALGASGGLAVLAKFSALLFLPVCAAAVVAARVASARGGPRPPASSAPPRAAQFRRGAVVAAWSALLLMWAAYRFSLRTGAGLPVPFPELIDGLLMVAAHNEVGTDSFLLGEVSRQGWWYFFPVVLAVKTPLAFLALVIAGGAEVVRRWRATRDWQAAAPLLCALAIVLVSMTSRINIGLRHVLPAYPLLAITAALGATALWRSARHRVAARAAAVACGAWLLVASARAHPDYLAYFNELAERHPERVLVNGDLDWGQDLLRLTDTLRARGIDRVSLAYFGSADPKQFHIAGLRCLRPEDRPDGWVAASEYLVKGVNPKRSFTWLGAHTPVTRVGASILLYHLPPRGAAPASVEPPPRRCFGS